MKKADIVLKSNAIFSGTTDKVFNGGIAVRGNKIVSVGSDSVLDEWIGSDTKVFKYDDELILPGLIDSHMHPFLGALVHSDYTIPLFDTRSEAQCAQIVKDYADKHPEFDKIVGMGWFPASWDNSHVLPSCSSLDAVVPDKPVYLLATDGHTFWLNSRALAECHITKDTKVSFGEIGKDANGRLNGLLFEIEAQAPAFEKAFSDFPFEVMKQIQEDFYKKVSKNGITSITNMSTSPIAEKSFKEIEVAADLEREGKLTARLHLYPSLGIDTSFDSVRKLKEKYHSDTLRVSGLKQFVDGVTSTYSAYLLEPYQDRPQTAGFSNYPADFYKERVAKANREGFSARLHAVGDAAVRIALDAYERSNQFNDNRNIRNTIEHIENINAADIARFSQLGVVPSMQPRHLIIEDNEKIQRLGEERCKYEWPHKSLIDSGATLAFSSDFPIVDINPFPNIYAAVTRCDDQGRLSGINPQEKISVAQALRAYTFGSAFAIHRETQLGTLETGKLADIVVLDKNLFDVPHKQIPTTRVKLTMMNGQIVYRTP